MLLGLSATASSILQHPAAGANNCARKLTDSSTNRAAINVETAYGNAMDCFPLDGSE